MREKTSSTTKDVIRIFWHHVRPYRGKTILLFSVIFIAEGTSLFTPWLYARLIDRIIQMQNAGMIVVRPLVLFLAFIVACRFCGWMFWRMSGFLTAIVQPGVKGDLEQTSFQYLLRHSQQFFSSTFMGALVRRVRGLSGAFETVADGILWRIFPVTITLTGIIGVMSWHHPIMGLILFAWAITFIILNVTFVRWKRQYDLAKSAKDSEVTAVLSDALTNNTNIQLFNGYLSEHERFAVVREERTRLGTLTWHLREKGAIVENALSVLTEFCIMFSAIYFWSKNQLTVGDVVLVQSYLINAFRMINDIGTTFRKMHEALADAKEMVDILNTPHEIKDKPRAKALKAPRGKIEFKDVIFNYHKTRKVLDHLDLSIRSREKVALVGSSGAGKSTVIKVLFRFYDIDRGKILIDGQSIKDVTQDSLRDAISLVPQEPILFHRTLMENIRYGRREATDQEVMDAAQKAHCHEFIEALPEKYQTFVGERGIKLSGGERQRVAIARAILKNAPILVLDEATSSLDSESEALIQDALHTLMQDKTVIVIAHRLSTIMQMDRIIVMEHGKVVDSGTHAELVQQAGIYQKLWKIQAGGFLK